MTFICFKQNIRLRNFRDSQEIQEYKLHIALSIINDFFASLIFCKF